MADDDRNQEMQQQFNELRKAIASDVAEQLKAGERRLRDGLSKELDAKFEASERRLTATLTQVIVRQLETAQEHLEGRLQMHMEDLKGLVTTTAECYGGTLERIERDLGDLKDEMVTKFSAHDKTLANHKSRLVTLEES